jgi:hypothetical protein
MVSQLCGECGGLELLPGGAHQAGQGRAGLLRQQQGCSARPRSAGMLGHACLLHLQAVTLHQALKSDTCIFTPGVDKCCR